MLEHKVMKEIWLDELRPGHKAFVDLGAVKESGFISQYEFEDSDMTAYIFRMSLKFIPYS